MVLPEVLKIVTVCNSIFQLSNEALPLVPTYRDLLLSAIDHGKLDIAEKLVKIGVNCKRKEKVLHSLEIHTVSKSMEEIIHKHRTFKRNCMFILIILFYSITTKMVMKCTWMLLIVAKERDTMSYCL